MCISLESQYVFHCPHTGQLHWGGLLNPDDRQGHSKCSKYRLQYHNNFLSVNDWPENKTIIQRKEKEAEESGMIDIDVLVRQK